MSDRTFGRKKATTSTFSNPSLVSPHTPILANPVRGFGLLTNNIIQAQTSESTDQQEAQAADERSKLLQALEQPSFGHDISRIALRRPQAKLTVGEPGDKYEQEADWMANQVMRMVVPDKVNAQSVQSVQDSLQRKCAACEQEEDKVQTKPSIQTATDGGLQAGSNIESRLNSSKGGGSPLPDEVRSFMEPRFGADFSQVRVHTGSEAVQMNQDLNAQAFTHKQDVYFGAGKAPAKDALTAHELTHVVQQTGAVQTKQISEQPIVQLKCSACENEEAEVQRSPNVSAISEPGIQRWSLFEDDEEKKELEGSSGGGVLDWAKEKASGAVDSVSQAGGDAVDWAKEKGGAAVDTVTQAGGDAVDWAKQKGGAVVDTVTQAGSDAVDWAKQKGGAAVDTVTQAGSDIYNWAKEKASALVQISGAIQKISGQEFLSLTDNQIATLNGYFATLREKSQGSINLPGIVAQTDSVLSATTPGRNLVSVSTIESILLNLQSSISAPFLSPDPVSSASDSGIAQDSIQRTVLAPPLVGAGIGAGVGGPPGAVIGFVIGIIVLIIMIIVAAPLIAKKIEDDKDKEKEKEKEKEEKKKKSQKCSDEVVTTLNQELHESCDKKRSCSLQGDDCTSATAKVSAGMGCVAGRTALQQKCFSKDDPGFGDHMKQIAEASASLRNCIEVMHEKCGDRK
ncbi:DUF4157 domain-containing protein [Nostoc sp. UIC 10630]|uniref:eCIS core domain-containing protein n=1 Tax=Nostoc sp. UIC 10630 TaxID=2100146 RepID=UPI0013D841DD|nr:DUF4157 domain-containing protein [Nostoc sp. UIC 10630]NEU77633.1 DUF4157 domain-containing protein [Nostoc sp. UIC 10630]